MIELNYLQHHGVKGQKWGVRRYQNADGTLTVAGKRRLKADGSFKSDREYKREISDTRSALTKQYKKKYGVDEAYRKADEEFEKLSGYNDKDLEKIYAKAESLSRKACKDVDAEMNRKYGEDYQKFLKNEQTQGTIVVAGALVMTAAVYYGGFKALQAGGKALINLGEKAVKRAIG